MSYKEIKLSFPFSPVNGVEEKDILGYAAIGTFEKNNGWTGIKEVFQSEMGNCYYSRVRIVAIKMAEETTEYFVNKKHSNKTIEGNINTGFLYNVNWYENTNTGLIMRTLECANKSFKPEIMEKMIVLANKIDKG